MNHAPRVFAKDLERSAGFPMRETAGRRLAAVQQHLRGSEAHTAGKRDSAKLDARLCSGQGRQLEGKVVVITGSGQGVGAAAAKLFAQHGGRIVVSDIDNAKAKQTAAAITSAGGEALVVPGDVTDPDFPEKIVKATMNKYGALDFLINNAGYTWDSMIHRMSPKQWEAMLAVHCTAPFRLIQAAAPYMRDVAKQEVEDGTPRKDRCILNVSSSTGTHGNPGQANYATAKAGILGLTKTVAKEWGPFGIRCNAVTFGFIATRLTGEQDSGESITVNGESVKLGIPGGDSVRDMAAEIAIPLKRVGTAEEAAGAMLLLCLPYASFITGQSLEVTGGAFI